MPSSKYIIDHFKKRNVRNLYFSKLQKPEQNKHRIIFFLCPSKERNMKKTTNFSLHLWTSWCFPAVLVHFKVLLPQSHPAADLWPLPRRSTNWKALIMRPLTVMYARASLLPSRAPPCLSFCVGSLSSAKREEREFKFFNQWISIRFTLGKDYQSCPQFVLSKQCWAKNSFLSKVTWFLICRFFSFLSGLSRRSRLLPQPVEESDAGQGGRWRPHWVPAQDVSLGGGFLAQGQRAAAGKQQVSQWVAHQSHSSWFDTTWGVCNADADRLWLLKLPRPEGGATFLWPLTLYWAEILTNGWISSFLRCVPSDQHQSNN